MYYFISCMRKRTNEPLMLSVNFFFFFCSIEMRHSVTTRTYLLRKFLDRILYSLTSPLMISLESFSMMLATTPYPPGGGKPKAWIPLYTMVTFRPDMSYATVKKKAARQAAVLTWLGWIGVAVLGLLTMWIVWLGQQLLAHYFYD